MNARPTVLVLFLIMLLTTGCSDFRRYTSRSPDGKASVVVREPSYFNRGVRVEFQEGNRHKELYGINGDYIFTVAEVYWSADQNVFGVFTCGSPILEIAANRRTLEPVPFSTVWPAIRAQLRTRFRLPAQEDVRTWVCQYGATEAVVKEFGNGTN